MNDRLTYEKKPAFFRVAAAVAFFEAEAADNAAILGNLNAQTEIDAELDALLGA
ncbi:hypothetical protein [Nocardia sp. NPDC047648]|uniref:hypothetical protein n=1 Tax=Nocardia sp. NPDC047648 TaxID=3155625 RepID=UPI00340ADF39